MYQYQWWFVYTTKLIKLAGCHLCHLSLRLSVVKLASEGSVINGAIPSSLGTRSFTRSLQSQPFHNPVEQDRKLSNIEKTALRIILQDNYISYEAALEMTGLSSLSDRRAAHLLSFSRRASRHPVHGPRMFPLNPDIQDIHNLRTREKFHVNFSRGATYFKSTIPTAQRLLNSTT